VIKFSNTFMTVKKMLKDAVGVSVQRSVVGSVMRRNTVAAQLWLSVELSVKVSVELSVRDSVELSVRDSVGISVAGSVRDQILQYAYDC